jgi:hypothetical protein
MTDNRARRQGVVDIEAARHFEASVGWMALLVRCSGLLICLLEQREDANA